MNIEAEKNPFEMENHLPNLHFGFQNAIWVFPKIGGKPTKWMVYNGKPY